MTNEEAFICVQCTASTGERGTFMVQARADRKPISPVFPDLASLFPWMHERGWRLNEYTPQGFVPLRVERDLTCVRPG